MIYNVVLLSAVQQSESVTHIHVLTVFRFFSPIGHYRVLVVFYAMQQVLSVVYFGISLEGMMLKLKLQYFGHLMRRVDSLEKTNAMRDWGQEEKGTTEDGMAGWHHRFNGHEFG